MLSFDIETEGLHARQGHKITVICTECFHTREKRAYEFAKHAHDADKLAQLREDVITAFDAAPSLCAFNGIKFDLPFMAIALKLPYDTVKRWKSKTSDILESCREVYMHTFSLNLLCEKNEIPIKISTGLAAIKMAADGEYDNLREYCEADVTILNNLYAKRYILNPRNNAVMDLAKWTFDGMYPFATVEDTANPDTIAKAAEAMVNTKHKLDRLGYANHKRMKLTADLPEPTHDKPEVPHMPDLIEG